MSVSVLFYVNLYCCIVSFLVSQVADKIGVLRRSDATMHIYINGIDQGVACTGVKEVSITSV